MVEPRAARRLISVRKLFKTDIKPNNYNYLTSNIIPNVSHEGKVKFLQSLEKLLLGTIIQRPPLERKISLVLVRTFKGKNLSRVLSVWLSNLKNRKKVGALLLKANRFKFN